MKKLLLVCLLTAGCGEMFVSTTTSTPAGTTVEAAPNVAVTQDRVDQVAINDICADVARTRGAFGMNGKIAELRLKSDFTANDIALISRGEVAIGMTQQAAICALGGNSRTIQTVKNTTSPGHVREELIFNGTPEVTLFTDNYIVTGVRQ